MSGTRVSNSLLAQLSIRNINANMQELLTLQYQLATGLRLYKPSIDPSGAAVAMSFQSLIERREQTGTNISRSNAFLTATDNALADLQDILNEATSVASTNIGAGSDDETRQNAAAFVSSLIGQLAQLGNRQYQGRYLFGGQSTTVAPFDLSDTMVQFVGDIKQIVTTLDSSSSVAYNVTAEEAFGTLSGRVTSLNDLNPDVTFATRLSELNHGEGVRLGTIILSDGTDTTQVDLSACDTVADVVAAINTNGVVNVTATLNASGNGLRLAGGAGDTISCNDLPGGFTARDLGILQTTALPAGMPIIGADLDRILSLTTELTALCDGAGIDTVNGMRITIGGDTATIDLSTAQTMEDLLNAINYCGLSAKAWIADDGRNLVIANLVSSDAMTIGENSGTCATDLGVRTMHSGTLMSDLNGGAGVRTVTGDDFEIVCSDGSVIGIDCSSISTLDDLITAINTDAANGGRVTADFNVVGNGIRLTDTTGGADDFQVRRANGSFAATDLGIEQTVANPTAVINGDDVAPVEEQGVFRSLFALRDALLANDDAAISEAGSALQTEISRVARIRGVVGARMQLLETTSGRIEDELLQIEGLLSEVRDLDYAEAVSRFQTLQTTFQASLQTAANVLPMSLMDFLT
ncbi:MAG: hypothetical protein JXL80_07755 [Planctomycetes bacterium]|nr:hypothetical protein [Planctomycetota bacterium]